MPHHFDPTILREYDIPGIVGQTLSAADARAIGRAYAVTLGEAGGRRAAVGYDGRLTSPELEAALVEGLAEGGADVVRIGRGPTPMLYYAAAVQKVGQMALALGPAETARGRVDEHRVFDDYIERLVRDYDGSRPLTV